MDNSKPSETLLDLALFRLYSREPNQARQPAQSALALAEQTDAQAMIAAVHCVRGILCLDKGELETARNHLEQADEIFSTRRYRDFNRALLHTNGNRRPFPDVAVSSVTRMGRSVETVKC